LKKGHESFFQIEEEPEKLFEKVLSILLEIERNGGHFFCFWGRGDNLWLLRWGLRVMEMPARHGFGQTQTCYKMKLKSISHE
jgi:hypothetical protein